jgi:2-(1,2-epoxy-1,2-dihydrophenyl)acetyl-CoA isomerase
MKALSEIKFSIEGGLAVITLASQGSSNAIGGKMAHELLNVAIECDEHPDVRAVLLKAEGKSFSGGGDLKSFLQIEDKPRHIKEITADFHAAISKLMRMQAPLVVAVQGAAVGAGLSLAALGDIVIAGRSASFMSGYSGIGLVPDGAGSYTLPRLIGMRRFQEIYLLNKVISAEEAASIGLITSVVDDAMLQDEALKLAQRLAAGPTKAYGAMRRLALNSFSTTLETQMELESRAISSMCRTADVQEGMTAMVERRRPTFKGC